MKAPSPPPTQPTLDPDQRWAQLEQILGYTFRDRPLLHQALTHRSFVHEARRPSHASYERLEFLGDAVLELVISHHVWQHFPHLPEGDLTRMRAYVVRRTTLANIARRLQLGEHLRLGRGERMRGGQDRASLLADTIEAILGAIYLDGGLNAARMVCFRIMAPELQNLDPADVRNYKNLLQELAARLHLPAPVYTLVSTEGPEHEPTFLMQGTVAEHYRATASGASKKATTQHVARQLYHTLKSDEEHGLIPTTKSTPETHDPNAAEEITPPTPETQDPSVPQEADPPPPKALSLFPQQAGLAAPPAPSSPPQKLSPPPTNTQHHPRLKKKIRKQPVKTEPSDT